MRPEFNEIDVIMVWEIVYTVMPYKCVYILILYTVNSFVKVCQALKTYLAS